MIELTKIISELEAVRDNMWKTIREEPHYISYYAGVALTNMIHVLNQQIKDLKELQATDRMMDEQLDAAEHSPVEILADTVERHGLKGTVTWVPNHPEG